MQRYRSDLISSGARRLRVLVLGGLLLGAVAVPGGAQALGADLLSGDSFILGPNRRPCCIIPR